MPWSGVQNPRSFQNFIILQFFYCTPLEIGGNHSPVKISKSTGTLGRDVLPDHFSRLYLQAQVFLPIDCWSLKHIPEIKARDRGIKEEGKRVIFWSVQIHKHLRIYPIYRTPWTALFFIDPSIKILCFFGVKSDARFTWPLRKRIIYCGQPVCLMLVLFADFVYQW